MSKEKNKKIFTPEDAQEIKRISGDVDKMFNHAANFKRNCIDQMPKYFPPSCYQDIEEEQFEYTCNKCNPPKVFTSKQSYGGHTKGHSRQEKGVQEKGSSVKQDPEVKMEEPPPKEEWIPWLAMNACRWTCKMIEQTSYSLFFWAVNLKKLIFFM